MGGGRGKGERLEMRKRKGRGEEEEGGNWRDGRGAIERKKKTFSRALTKTTLVSDCCFPSSAFARAFLRDSLSKFTRVVEKSLFCFKNK